MCGCDLKLIDFGVMRIEHGRLAPIEIIEARSSALKNESYLFLCIIRVDDGRLGTL